MAFNNVLPLTPGQSSTSAVYAGTLGEVYEVGATGSPGWKLYRMVKNGTTVLSKNMAVVTALTAGSPTWVVDVTTTANDQNRCGVVPSDFGSNTIAAGAYFLVQIAGLGTPNFANTSLTRTTTGAGLLGTATTAGYVQAFTAATDAVVVIGSYLAQATNSAGVTAAGQPGTAWLEGLL